MEKEQIKISVNTFNWGPCVIKVKIRDIKITPNCSRLITSSRLLILLSAISIITYNIPEEIIPAIKPYIIPLNINGLSI